ncbi:hypothetical protein [Sinosporangium siamense]|uniref:Uncharacterized protein n=1 Tax=Sinosporangium siamense TaxID=1367973 RepID=A0A919RB82_9ACTN|nr:hypothetical protein [Sinosporangium siamense]GII90442.1 hypothetical protein Ssi02_06730 [Sinosporangium siamense]
MSEVSIDQILFAWDDPTLTGPRGLGPVATSLPPAEVVKWEQRLLSPDWAAAEADQHTTGEAALLLLRFEQEAAVVCKRSVRDPHGWRGSTVAHALVGPAHLLTAEIALGLAPWAGWIEEDDRFAGERVMEAVPYDALRLTARAGLVEVRNRARARSRHHLAELFELVLRDPEGCFTLIRPEGDAAELVCAVVDVMGESPAVPWTFATREAVEPCTPNRPRIVAVTEPPRPDLAATGHRARLGAASIGVSGVAGSGDDMMPDLAMALAVAYRHGGTELVRALRTRGPISTSDDALDWTPSWAGIVRLMALTAAESMAYQETRALHAWAARAKENWAELDSAALAEVIDGLAATGGDFAEVADKATAVAVQRFMTGVGDEQALRGALTRHRPPAFLVQAELRALAARATQSERLRYIERAVAMGLDFDTPEVNGLLSAAPTAELLSAVARCAELSPDLALLLMERAAARQDSMRERDKSIAAMTQHDFLVPAVERVEPRDLATQSRILQCMLAVSYGEALADAWVIREVIQKSSGAPVLLHAMIAQVRDPKLATLILEHAGTRWFADQGLPPPSRALNSSEPAQSLTTQQQQQPARPLGAHPFKRWWWDGDTLTRLLVGGAGVIAVVALLLVVAAVVIGLRIL